MAVGVFEVWKVLRSKLKDMNQHPACGQCGRPAICSINKVNLCVDCYSRYQAATSEQLRQQMAMMNFYMDEMDNVVGLPGSGPRFKLPVPSPIIATQGSMTFHNINVQGSVVGAINTGQVQQIDVALDHIKLGDAALAQSVAHFTEALIADTKLDESEKKEVLEQLSFLTTQTVTPKEDRKPGMARSVVDGVSKAVSISTSLLALWDKLHPLLKHALET